MSNKVFSLIVILVVISFICLIVFLDRRGPQLKYNIDLPEEIMAADSTDTMDAVLRNDTIFITFRNQHK